MNRPDYHQSIVNIISSIAGEKAPANRLYPALPSLSELSLTERPVALLVIDGLGYQFLQSQPQSFIYQYLHCRLTSVFPTTTATAVTALALGVPAQQHGISGWFTYLKELGCVAAPLPFMPRGGGANFARLGVKANAMLDASPLLPQLDRPTTLVNPNFIDGTPYSVALFGRTPRAPHQGITDLFQQVERSLRQEANPLVWAYWTELDSLAHAYGVASEQVAEHFQQIDNAFKNFVQCLEDTNAIILLTADHGLIDTRPERVVHLHDHPQMDACLALPLCGEPRTAFCYLRAGAEKDFDDYVSETLSEQCDLISSQLLLDQGMFGLGGISKHLRDRVGDRTLLMKSNWVIKDRLLQEKAFDLVGVHGGLSDDELYVPLVVVEP